MTEQCRHGAVTAQGGAVHFDKAPLQLVASALEFIDAPGQEGFARAGRADQQHRCPRAQGHSFDLLDGAVEGGVAGGDTGLEKVQAVGLLALKARGDVIVARQVQVNQRAGAGRVGRVFLAAGWRGLDQPRRQVARLGEQEPADLRDVGAGGDVDQVVLVLGIERVGAGKIVQGTIDLLEVPGIAQDHGLQAHLGVWRDALDVVTYALGQAQIAGAGAVDQLQAIDRGLRLLAQADGRAPALPARGAFAVAIKGGAEKTDGDATLAHFYLAQKINTYLIIYKNLVCCGLRNFICLWLLK
ncbi:hypothetical protein D3C79_606470 [compost metagenome]